MTQLLQKISKWSDELAQRHIDDMYPRYTLNVTNQCVNCPSEGTKVKKLETCLECHFLEKAEKNDGGYTQIICKPPTNVPYL